MTEIPFYNERYLELNKAISKLNYFFLAVIIGLLSLSIQTYNITENYRSLYLLIGTWLLLIISFFAGFMQELFWIKFRQVDLQRSKDEELAKKFKNAYYDYINYAFRVQFSTFYLAIIFYALFKISNMYCISLCVEILILSSAVVLGICGIIAYHFIVYNVSRKQ